MYSPATSSIMGIAAMCGFLGGAAVLPVPAHEFMHINSIEQIGAMVHPDRVIYGTRDGEPVIADWRVTVIPFGQSSPICNTIPGPELNQGWSRYDPATPRKNTPITLDVWVGDEGCWSRLEPGDYIEVTTWTPRGESSTVVYHRTFKKP
jgi:hypothetical protein